MRQNKDLVGRALMNQGGGNDMLIWVDLIVNTLEGILDSQELASVL